MLARLFAIFLFLFATALPGHAINIRWDFSLDTGNFWTAERRLVLDYAAQQFAGYTLTTPDWSAFEPYVKFEVNLEDPITPDAVWQEMFPQNQTLTIYVGASDLGERTLGMAMIPESRYTILDERGAGFGEALQSTNTNTVFQPYVGLLYATTRYTFYSGLDDTVPAEEFDLFSMVVHELGHILGIGMSNAWYAHVVDGRFMGENVLSIIGAEGLELTGEDFAHLPEGYNMGKGAAGHRFYFSEVEYAILRDLGYQSIPEPSAAWLVPGGAALLYRRRFARRR